MKLPFRVLDLTAELRTRWNTYFSSGHDRQRYIEEGIWRRTQNEDNKIQSGWSREENSRRRIVHYRYKYGCTDDRLELQDFYLLHCLTIPRVEADDHERTIYDLLAKGGWRHDGHRWRRGDLICSPMRYAVHPKDIEAGRSLPPDYESLEVTIQSHNNHLSSDVVDLPWQVLAGGPRIKDRRGDPKVVDNLDDIRDHLPFQIEVGCGTSFEAGVPPLHRLHEIYRVTGRDNNSVGNYSFTLAPADDPLLCEVLTYPEKKFAEFVEMFRACFIAEPTPGLKALRDLADRGHVIGPVITNNFDVLAARAGLEECFVRRYDQKIPDVPFFPEAKSLLVVGNHADRRAVQSRARARGLKIFFLDPEGFWLGDGFEPYPLESAQTGDVLCRKEATPGLIELAELLP